MVYVDKQCGKVTAEITLLRKFKFKIEYNNNKFVVK